MRIRGLHVHDERVEAARAGRRVALNLAGVERDEVRRGDVVVAPHADVAPTYLIDAALTVLPGARPLRTGAVVHVHHGTRDVPARVAPLEGAEVLPGRDGLVQLRLQQPLVPLAGDRFVLRTVAPPDTVAGGIVLDPRPRKHGGGEQHLRRLRARREGDPLEALRLEVESARSGVGPEAGGDLLAGLEREGTVVRAGSSAPRWFTVRNMEAGRERVLAALARERGAGRGAIAAMAGLEPAAVSALVEDLVAAGAVEERGGVLAAAARPEDPHGARLADLVRADGHAPRAPDALAREAGIARPAALASLDRLVAEGALVRAAPGVYFDPGAFEDARRVVVAHCEREGSITIAALRDALGVGRKHAQAILEHLDAARVTRRQGDEHVLRTRRF